MRSFQIQDQLKFMKKLLFGGTFDAFLLSDASITTYAAFHIDGSFHPEYFGNTGADSASAAAQPIRAAGTAIPAVAQRGGNTAASDFAAAQSGGNAGFSGSVEVQSGYTLWKRVRPFFLELTKGKHTPLRFRIVFRLSQHNTEKLLAQCGAPVRPEQVDGLFLNISFDGSSLSCTSGVSLRIFSLDKSLEHAWDDALEQFLRREEIPFL